MNSNKKKMSSTSKTRTRPSNTEKANTSKKKSQSSTPEISKVEKKMWSVEELTKSMKPSSEELKFREKKLQESDIVQKSSKFFRCTKCLLNFNPIIEKKDKIPVHPKLGVLMCKTCCNYYEDGEFSVDSDGEDKYCRWCGEGGTIFGCAKCICGFCATCLKRHFTPKFLKNVKNDDHWLCFFCNPEPLWQLRFICFLAEKTSEGVTAFLPKINKNNTECLDNTEKSPTAKSLTIAFNGKKKKFRKRVFLRSSDESEVENAAKKLKLTQNSPQSSSEQSKPESFKNIKSNIIGEVEKVLRLSECQFNFGANWCNKMLKKFESLDCLSLNKNLANECKKIKWFLSILSTNLVQFCNTMDSVEKSLLNKDEMKASEDTDKNESPYTTILQFLGFITNQIKVFMEKGINLSDILEATVYDDKNILGLKKKMNSPILENNSPIKEKNINSVESQTSFKPNDSMNTESRESTQEPKDENESEKSNLDVFDDNDENSEMNCTEVDKELSCSNVTMGETGNLKTTNPEEDLQEILAILENA